MKSKREKNNYNNDSAAKAAFIETFENQQKVSCKEIPTTKIPNNEN